MTVRASIHNVTPVCRPGVTAAGWRADALLVAGTAPGWLDDLDAALAGLAALGLSVHLLAVNRAITLLDMPIEHAATVHPSHLRGWLSQGRRVGEHRPLTHGPGLSGAVDVAWRSPVPLGGSAHLAVMAGLGLGYRRIVLAGVRIDSGTTYEPMQRWWRRDLRAFADRARCVSTGWLRNLLGGVSAEWLEA